MKILFVHNNYASNNSGEEHASQGLAELLTKNGHIVDWYRKSSDVIDNSLLMKFKAFFGGFYNYSAVRELSQKINDFKPDVIQVQNMYPFISPAILKMIKRKNTSVILRASNYRLFCPTGLHLDGQSKLCEQCLSGIREFNCIKKNCENDLLKSIGYALRGFFARTIWGVTKNFDAYIVQTEFQKKKFVNNGIPYNKLFVVPGLTPEISEFNFDNIGESVLYVGRISREKGIEELIAAAKNLPEITFNMVGSVLESYNIVKENSPKNVVWHGFIKGVSLDALFQSSRIVVVPSKCYEGFPNVITRAMKHKKPVITSNIGAMASIIDHTKNGILVPPNDAKALEKAIYTLYNDELLCSKLGKAGSNKADRLYSDKTIIRLLESVYNYVT